MKNQKSYICLILLAIVFSISAKQSVACQSDFTWVQSNPNEITFTNTSTGVFNYGWWSFGDGTSAGVSNLAHVYNVPGTYTVCLMLQDSTSGCNSTFCDTITVTGSLNCNVVAYPQQGSPATCATCADGFATVVATGGTPPFTYSWNTNPVETTSTAAGLLPGSYSVCVTDANGCTSCSSVTIDSSGCRAAFGWYQSSTNTITFIDSSSGLNFYTNYFWNFSDGTTDYVANPVHFYTSPGTYNVCLTINDSASGTPCYSNYCMVVTVTGVVCNLTVTVAGTDATCGGCADGSASANVTGGTGPYVYNWSPGGQFGSTATGLSAGYYSVCVTDANGCSACNTILIGPPNSGTCQAYFTLTPDTNILHTYNVVNLATGIQPMSYSWLWGDGTSSNTAYPTHTYASAGFYTICLTVYDSTGCVHYFCDSMYLLKTSNTMIDIKVYPPTATEVRETESLNGLAVYPNPVIGDVKISYRLSAPTDVEIVVYDVLGNRIENILNTRQPAGRQNLLWNADKLQQGIYFLRISMNGATRTERISVLR